MTKNVNQKVTNDQSEQGRWVTLKGGRRVFIKDGQGGFIRSKTSERGRMPTPEELEAKIQSFMRPNLKDEITKLTEEENLKSAYQVYDKFMKEVQTVIPEFEDLYKPMFEGDFEGLTISSMPVMTYMREQGALGFVSLSDMCHNINLSPVMFASRDFRLSIYNAFKTGYIVQYKDDRGPMTAFVHELGHSLMGQMFKRYMFVDVCNYDMEEYEYFTDSENEFELINHWNELHTNLLNDYRINYMMKQEKHDPANNYTVTNKRPSERSNANRGEWVAEMFVDYMSNRDKEPREDSLSDSLRQSFGEVFNRYIQKYVVDYDKKIKKHQSKGDKK